jgi:cellulose synthase/poly-beta-1,6-N-acetylglucosamine synthase-like glycosyltransferase
VILLGVLFLITTVAGFSQLLAYRRMYRYVKEELRREGSTYRPKVAVIMPCKGLDPGFQTNAKKLFEQDYFESSEKKTANFEIVFSVASIDDPAYPVLSELIARYPNIKAQLVVAKKNSFRAQKINNQLTALKQISSATEVLVFVDSDMIARSNFISCLVAPLSDPNVGISTGYRFYIPLRGDWPSLLRSLWNRVTAWELANQKFAFAWGGAMAITKENFQKAGIEKVWDRAADDDLSMTTAVKKLGLKVRFVPQCLVASDGDASLKEIIEWTNRQLILTKVYYPALWRRAIVRAVVLGFWLIAVVACIYEGLIGGSGYYQLAGCLGLSLPIVELFFLIQAQKLWKQVLFHGAQGDHASEIDRAYDKSLWRSICALPLAHCILPWITLNSVLTNRISWRGITYELKGPNEIVVV